MVSVIIPVYNCSEYLDECLVSIVNQTYSDLEIILVDDGSIDTSGNICDKWAERDNRVHVIHSSNKGAGAARNLGLNVSTGDYIVFCDGDDYYETNAISLLYDAIVKNDADISIANIRRVNTKKEKLDIESGLIFDKAGVYYEKDVWEHISKGYWGIILLTSRIFKREVWDNVRFPEIKAYEDEAVLHLLLARVNKIVFIEEEIYNYRQSEGSIMRSPGTIKKLLLSEVLIQRIIYLYSKGFDQGAEFNFYKGIWAIAEAASNKHTSDREVKKVIRLMRKQYRGLSKMVLKHAHSLKQVCKLLLSQFSLNLYMKFSLNH